MSRLALLFLLCTFPFLTLGDGNIFNRIKEALIKAAIVSANIYLNNMKNLTIIEAKEINLNNIGLDFFAGTTKLQHVVLTGLEGLNHDKNLIVSIDDDTNVLTLGINATMLPVSGLITYYEADVGLFNSIPIYGKGDFKCLVKNMAASLSTTVNLTDFNVQTLNIFIRLRANQMSVSGFWKNPELSQVLSQSLSTLEYLAIMFYNSEIDCISCIISILMKTIINSVIHPKEQGVDITQYLSMAESECQATCSLSKNTELRGLFQGTYSVRLSEYNEQHFKNTAEILTRSVVAYLASMMMDKLGTLKITDPLLQFNFTHYQNIRVNKNETSGDYTICVNGIIAPDWFFSCHYEADMVINDEIPLYGTGQYKGRLSDVSISLCYTVPQNFEQILHINIDFQFRHGPASLEGLFNNPDLTPIISDFLTKTRYVIAMWNTYERECFQECILDPILLYITNILIYNIDKMNEVDWRECSCIEIVKEKLKNEVLKTEHFNSYKNLLSSIFSQL